MAEYARFLNLKKLVQQNSILLLGPRGTGKSFWIEKQFPSDFYIDLLDDDLYQALLKRPKQLSEMIPSHAKLAIIDEIQRVPELLNEVHRLIEKQKIKFLLTGSSARKLKKEGVNLLAGRMWEKNFFPLSSYELKQDFQLLKYVNGGGLPRVYNSADADEELHNYVNLYLREEIKGEALTRKYDLFLRFLDVVGLNNGKEIVFQNISNDSGVPPRTVENYLEVLRDTLIGFYILPFMKTKTRKAITRSKFYFFDLGVARIMAKLSAIKEGSTLFGDAFEHFIILEVKSSLHYKGVRKELSYWRTKNGFEVDLIIGNDCAVEIKSSSRISEQDLRGLKALREEGLLKRYCVVCQEPVRRVTDGIEIIPYRAFLKEIWGRSPGDQLQG